MISITYQSVRNKASDLTGDTLLAIAETMLELENEKEELEQRVADLTAERDELLAKVS